MLQKQLERDSDNGYENRRSASREEQNETKLSAEMRSCLESVFCALYCALIHLTLIAGTLGPPQFVHLFVNLSITTSPILRLHA